MCFLGITQPTLLLALCCSRHSQSAMSPLFSLLDTCKGSAEERMKAKCQSLLLRPSFLLSQPHSCRGQRGLWLKLQLYSSVGLGAKLRCERPAQGDRDVLQVPWVSYQLSIDGSSIQITDSVISQPSCYSGLPLVTHHRFPAGRIFPGERVYSVSSKKFWSGNCSLQNLVGAHIELMSQWDWRAE